jgi:hypothetical protein
MRPPFTSWHDRIGLARNPATLVELARDFVAIWTPAELAQIPESCRPARMKDIGDIHHCSERLATEFVRLAQAGESAEGLDAMVAFFQKCSEQAATLGVRAPDEESVQRGNAA